LLAPTATHPESMAGVFNLALAMQRPSFRRLATAAASAPPALFGSLAAAAPASSRIRAAATRFGVFSRSSALQRGAPSSVRRLATAPPVAACGTDDAAPDPWDPNRELLRAPSPGAATKVLLHSCCAPCSGVLRSRFLGFGTPFDDTLEELHTCDPLFSSITCVCLQRSRACCPSDP
jgi:hypothetical protein